MEITYANNGYRKDVLEYIKENYKDRKDRLSQNELNSTIGINSTKTAAQNGSELFLGINNKIYMPL
jgi:hypothetical protein